METIFRRQSYEEVPLNLEIYSFIKPHTKVLDVGCGDGKLGAALKNKNCFRVGIEIDEKLAREAKSNYDRLIIADIEKLTDLPFSLGYFDIIIFADILEHLAYPEVVLFNLKNYLADSGYILVCIPNAANWQMRLRLLLGRLDYGPGILDGGHLRLFTLKTIKTMIENSGYRIVFIKNRNRIIKPLGKLYKKLFAFQFIIKAVKED